MLNRLAIAFTLALFTLALPGGADGHPNHNKKVLGSITMAAPDHVMVKTVEGKEETIKIDAKTKFVKGKAKAKLEDLKVGTRVVISLTDKEPPTAAEIQVGGAAGGKQ
jgi:hypothetical protein